jgi:hypothetical protein
VIKISYCLHRVLDAFKWDLVKVTVTDSESDELKTPVKTTSAEILIHKFNDRLCYISMQLGSS